MGFVNAGIDGTAFPSLPRPLRSGREKLGSFWICGEPEVCGCGEEEAREESSQMSLHVETGLFRLLQGFVCSAFRRNPAREQRSGQKCRYLFIQENSANNTYLGAFRNNRTRPTELLNQFGGDTPEHAGQEQGHRERQLEPEHHIPPGHGIPAPTPGGSRTFPGIPPSTGGIPFLRSGLSKSQAKA